MKNGDSGHPAHDTHTRVPYIACCCIVKYNLNHYSVTKMISYKIKHVLALPTHKSASRVLKASQCNECGLCFVYIHIVIVFYNPITFNIIPNIICHYVSKCNINQYSATKEISYTSLVKPFSCTECDFKYIIQNTCTIDLQIICNTIIQIFNRIRRR